MIYDVLIIGSGPGGYVAAIRAGQLGLKVACVDKGPLGGTCLNVGCIPSKSLLHASEHSTDFDAMMERKNRVVAEFNQGIEALFKKNKVTWIRGEAILKSGTLVEVKGERIEAKNIVLATGSEPTSLPFLPFDEERILSSTGALSLKRVPKELLIVGAGIIGVELGSVYQRLGSQVQFIEFLDRICPAFDQELSKTLQKSLTAQGMAFHLSHKVRSAKVEKSGALLIAEGPSGEKEFRGDAVLVAVGRRPFSTGLGLEELKIQRDPKGFVVVDDSFRTNIPTVFAIGDLINGPMLAHKASEEGVAVAELLAGLTPRLDYASIPNVAYTHPEVAAVGFTEEELKQRGVKYKTGRFPFKANSRAKASFDTDGLAKVLAEEGTDRLLGVHLIGPSASEIIAEATLAIRLRACAKDIAHTCHAHPTFSEALKEAALAVGSGALHI